MSSLKLNHEFQALAPRLREEITHWSPTIQRISQNLPSSTSRSCSRTCALRSTAPRIPPSAITRPTPIYETKSLGLEVAETNATSESRGTSGKSHGLRRCFTAAINNGAPVRMGGGTGWCSSTIGKGGLGRGKDKRCTASCQ